MYTRHENIKTELLFLFFLKLLHISLSSFLMPCPHRNSEVFMRIIFETTLKKYIFDWKRLQFKTNTRGISSFKTLRVLSGSFVGLVLMRNILVTCMKLRITAKLTGL